MGGQIGAAALPLNSAKIGLCTGGVCLKHPNEWHSVMFGMYCRVLMDHWYTLARIAETDE